MSELQNELDLMFKELLAVLEGQEKRIDKLEHSLMEFYQDILPTVEKFLLTISLPEDRVQ